MLLAVLVLMQLAHDALPSTWSYYTMLKFGWGPGDVAWSLVAIGALSAFSFAVLPRLVVPRIGERGAVYLGFATGALAYLGYALGDQGLDVLCLDDPFHSGRRGRPGAQRHHVPPRAARPNRANCRARRQASPA